MIQGVPEFCTEKLQVYMKKYDEKHLLKPIDELIQ